MFSGVIEKQHRLQWVKQVQSNNGPLIKCKGKYMKCCNKNYMIKKTFPPIHLNNASNLLSIACCLKFRKFTGKHLYWSLFFNKVTRLQACNFIKKRLQYRCFPKKFAKFLRTTFFADTIYYFIFGNNLLPYDKVGERGDLTFEISFEPQLVKIVSHTWNKLEQNVCSIQNGN